MFDQLQIKLAEIGDEINEKQVIKNHKFAHCSKTQIDRKSLLFDDIDHSK